jgi:hypothetical protein
VYPSITVKLAKKMRFIGYNLYVANVKNMKMTAPKIYP